MNIIQKIEFILQTNYYVTLEEASPQQLNFAISKAVMVDVVKRLNETNENQYKQKRAYYFSAEFLMGRAIFNNLFCLGYLDEIKMELNKKGIDINMLEEIEDDALGNGGLGRLAACFLDSAATKNLPLNGYGIRYQYGIFKQYLENGFQMEAPDNWQRFGDPWSIRKDDESVTVDFANQQVIAVPYDMPVIGYKTQTVNKLRLWQSESNNIFNLQAFNNQDYQLSVQEQTDAKTITRVLYPNDSTNEGKKLRLKQQYFFSSASLQDILRNFKKYHQDVNLLPEFVAIQLNDTHPAVSIPELIRLLMKHENVTFNDAFNISSKIFAYTNHTVMSEALEKWHISLFAELLPDVYNIIVQIQERLHQELSGKGIYDTAGYNIIEFDTIHMARLSVYGSMAVNGVAEIHSNIIKVDTLKEWYNIYPERFQNKTNGITQRRWLGVCNSELSDFITSRIGNGWLTDLSQLKQLEKYINDTNSTYEFNCIKKIKKEQLCNLIKTKESLQINSNFIFDVQVKRLHEYKRQLMNALSIIDIYFSIKDGSITDFEPTVFIFGAKSATGYFRAKGIIKYINCIANLINNDDDMNDKMKVVFASNYDVSYAEKIFPAADVSEQISTAGTEASGTGNMKFMLNGAVTLGTLDGANVEIVEEAGLDNNYIFGAKVNDILNVAQHYNPKEIYNNNQNIKRAVDTLIDGTFDDNGSGMFRELYHSLIDGVSFQRPDTYYILLDFDDYQQTRLRLNQQYKNKTEFAKKCIMNIANSGKFTSDRTILQYANEIWGIKPL